jgi:hypothetical protein
VTDTEQMRGLTMLLLVAALFSACSSPATTTDTSPDGARVLREPTDEQQELTSADEGGVVEVGESGGVLAFKPEDESTTDSQVDPSLEDAQPDIEADPEDQTEPAEEATELSVLIDELIGFVEQERGHEFTSRPGVALLEGEQFTAAWNELIREDAATYQVEYQDFTDIYRAMGIIDGSASLEQIWMRFGDAGVVGYYDSDTGGIVLRSGEITTFTKTVLVHELVHALDDQIFDIDRDEYDDRDDEIGWTFSAIREGSAGVIEERYRDALTSAERDEELTVQRSLPRSVSLSEFNDSFLELQFGRYRYGDEFAAALWNEGQSTFDDAFVTPPSTSEVVLDPAAYLRGERAEPAVDAPPADGTIFRSGVWGEAAWAAVLADVFDPGVALDFADGWGGDRFVAWRSGDETCVRLHVEADTPAHLDDYADALEEWTRSATGREIFYPTADLVRVTSCA